MTYRNSDGGGLMGAGGFRSKTLLQARALASKDWENPKDIQHARHMAHDGATTGQIAMALGWDVTGKAAQNRLKKYNIVAWRPSDRAHCGEITTLPYSKLGTNMQSYRPRQIGGAR